MFEQIHLVSVIVSAILAMAVGSIWYSPILFGNYWMRAVGFSPEQIENSKVMLPKLLAFGMVGNLILFYVIAHFVHIAHTVGYSFINMALLLLFLIGSIAAGSVIWENKPIGYFLINVGYIAIVIFGGMSVISFWPW